MYLIKRNASQGKPFSLFPLLTVKIMKTFTIIVVFMIGSCLAGEGKKRIMNDPEVKALRERVEKKMCTAPKDKIPKAEECEPKPVSIWMTKVDC